MEHISTILKRILDLWQHRIVKTWTLMPVDGLLKRFELSKEKEMVDPFDGKDEVLFWPDCTWHRCDPAEPDATERAIHDNGRVFYRLWFPEEMDDELLNDKVHEIIDLGLEGGEIHV